MRHVPAALQAHLDTGATTLCRCWRLARRDGTVQGFTDHDRPLAFDGLTHHPGAGFGAGALESATGLAADNIEVAGALTSDAITAADLEAGAYDDAEVDLFLVNWADPDQRVLLFRGSIGETSRGSHSFTAELRGMAHRLGQPTGRAFLRRCDAALGDARCGVALAPVPGTIAAIAPDGTLTIPQAATAPDGTYTHGLLAWTDGPNAGRPLPVRDHAGARLTLWSPPSAPPVPGESVTLTEGCDKRFETCRTRFANAPRFRGYPHMPGDDWMTRYPATGERNDGSPLG